jgi:hypothetical protein
MLFRRIIAANSGNRTKHRNALSGPNADQVVLIVLAVTKKPVHLRRGANCINIRVPTPC